MDNTKELRANLIQFALRSTNDMSQVVPIATKMLAEIKGFIETGSTSRLPSSGDFKPVIIPAKSVKDVVDKPSLPTIPTPKQKPVILTKTGRVSVKAYRRGGLYYTDEEKEKIAKMLEGKVVTKKTLQSVSAKTGRSVKGLVLALKKNTFPGIVYPTPATESTIASSVKRTMANGTAWKDEAAG